MRFALLETTLTATASRDSKLELVLKNGERLRIGIKMEAAMLRTVLESGGDEPCRVVESAVDRRRDERT